MLFYNELNVESKKALMTYIDCETEKETETFFRQKNFTLEIITIEEAKKRCMSFDFEQPFTSFEEYHAWYIQGGDIPNHGDSIYPVIEGGYGEWLDDGWHRFHSYVQKGFKSIPVLRIV